MNALTVLSLAVVAACGSAQILGYPGVYGAYSGLYPTAGAPLMYNMAQVAPVAPIQSQFHAQDEFGQYSFGFAGGPHSRSETRDAFGIVRGSYNYIDSEGEIQTQNYVADARGFRVSGTNLPVAEDAPAAALPGPLPEPVQYTPEVAAARADFMKAYGEAAAAAAAEPEVAAVPKAAADTEVAIVADEAAAEPAVLEVRKKRSAEADPSPLHFSYGFSAPLNYGYGYPGMVASPLQYNAAFLYAAAPAISAYAAGIPAITTYNAAAPAAIRDSELLRVVHNPKHAVSYRVD